MASLQNEQIDQSYSGLIKTANNATVGWPAVQLQDGSGKDIGIAAGDPTIPGGNGYYTQINGDIAKTVYLNVNSDAVNINSLGNVTPVSGGATFIGGTFNVGNAFGPATIFDFTASNTTVNGLVASDSASPVTVAKAWSGTEAQYNALVTYDANTIYYTT